jgi:EmrB/QacA subfamily drug resistance transporter
MLSFLGLLLETAVNVLFPALMSDFGIGMSEVSWMTTGYLLVVSVIMPLSGYLQCRFIAKSLFLTAAVAVMAGAFIAAVAPGYGVLLTGRLFQGIGTGIATPLMFTTIRMQAPRSRLCSLMGVGALVLGIAPALGPALGGVIGTVASWRVVFWMVLPLMAIALVVGVRCLEQPVPTGRERMSIGRLALLAVGLVGLIVGIERGGVLLAAGGEGVSGKAVGAVVALIVIGVGALAGFAARANHSDAPLIGLRILRSPTYTWSLAAFALLQFAPLGLGYILPNYAQLAFGREAMVAGLIGLPGAIIGAVFAPLGGMILDRVGAHRPIMLGASLALTGTVLLAVLAALGHISILTLCLCHFIYMFGFGLAFANTQTHGMFRVTGRLTADGTAVMNTAQQFFGALSTTVLSSLIAARQVGLTPGSPAYQAGTYAGSTVGFFVIAALIACALLAESRSFTPSRRVFRGGEPEPAPALIPVSEN